MLLITCNKLALLQNAITSNYSWHVPTILNNHTGSVLTWVNKDRVDLPIIPKYKQGRKLMTVAEWNVRILLYWDRSTRPERTALVVMELAKYSIDIAALCETRLSSSQNVTDIDYENGEESYYTFFWSGRSEEEWQEAGVGFAVKKDIVSILTEMLRPVPDRIITIQRPLDKNIYATLISVYALNLTNSD